MSQKGQPTFANFTYCEDVIGEHFDSLTGAELDHDFYLDRIEADHVPAFNGEFQYSDSPPLYVRARGWVPMDYVIAINPNTQFAPRPDNFGYPEWCEHLALFGQLSPVTNLLSMTNPNVPETDIPSFVIEGLRGLPELIYNKGTTLLSSTANFNLQWEFGWKPLLSDLSNLIAFGSTVDKRLSVLQKAVARGSLKATRRIERVSDSTTEPIEVRMQLLETDPYDSFFDGFGNPTITVTRETVLERWGTVRYTLPQSFLSSWKALPYSEKRWLAMRQAYGLHFQNPSALWEIIPWSWLVDWFIPFQKLLDTYNNFVPFEIKNLCVMTKATTRFTFGSVDHDFLSWDGPGSMVRTTLRREVLPYDYEWTGELPILHDVGLPIWSNRQVGILASIFGQRKRRK